MFGQKNLVLKNFDKKNKMLVQKFGEKMLHGQIFPGQISGRCQLFLHLMITAPLSVDYYKQNWVVLFVNIDFT